MLRNGLHTPRHSLLVPLREQSQVGEARRRAVGLAQTLRFSQPTQGRLALVVTEMAANVLRHAGGGSLVLSIPSGRNDTVEVHALDRGPGIVDLDRAMSDGFSTAGSQGDGLGTIARQADALDIYSRVGEGTVVMARLHEAALPADGPVPENGLVGSLCLPIDGERVSGDAVGVRRGERHLLMMVADGVGHGPAAAEASERALQLIEDDVASIAAQPPEVVLDRAHHALAGTRGAAIAVARVDLDDLVVRYAGIGNVQGTLVGPDQRRGLISHNGTVGWGKVRIVGFDHPLESETMLVMHSDGVSERWSLEDYPGLATRDPSLVAGVILRDHRRDRDDGSIAVFRPLDEARAVS